MPLFNTLGAPCRLIAALAFCLACSAHADDQETAAHYGFDGLDVVKIDRGAGPITSADMNADGLIDLIAVNNAKSRIELHEQKRNDLPLPWHQDRLVHLHVRNEPHERLVRPLHRATPRQSPHPPTSALHRSARGNLHAARVALTFFKHNRVTELSLALPADRGARDRVRVTPRHRGRRL